MDILDYVNPVRKDSLAEGDRMLVTNGHDIFAVPPTGGGSPEFPEVTDALGGIISMDEEAQTGKLSVEDLIVALVGIDQALKGSVDASFENAYSGQFDIDNVRHKLWEAMLLPEEDINIVDITDNEREGVITELTVSANYSGPNADTMTARSFDISCVNVESGSVYGIVDINYNRNGSLSFVIQEKEGLGAGTYDIRIEREPIGYYDAITLNYEYTIK